MLLFSCKELVPEKTTGKLPKGSVPAPEVTLLCPAIVQPAVVPLSKPMLVQLIASRLELFEFLLLSILGGA